jgi:c-di-GMP-binding flagellar brake protein YcgR
MEKNESGKDKRRFKRLRVNLAVLFRIDKPLTVRLRVGNKEARATMVDLSPAGLSMLTTSNIPNGSVLLMKFTLFKIENDDVSFYGPMEIIGEVRYNVPLTGKEYRLGISFKHISQQDKQEIAGFVQSRVMP